MQTDKFKKTGKILLRTVMNKFVPLVWPMDKKGFRLDASGIGVKVSILPRCAVFEMQKFMIFR